MVELSASTVSISKIKVNMVMSRLIYSQCTCHPTILVLSFTGFSFPREGGDPEKIFLSFYLWKPLPEWVSERLVLLIRNLELELRKKQPSRSRTRGKQTLTGLREKQLGFLTVDRSDIQYTQLPSQKSKKKEKKYKI